MSVALVGIAALHAACAARDQSAPPPTKPTVLDRWRFGNVIEDGLGYGGVRIGMTAAALSRAWGATVDTARNPDGSSYVRLFRLDTGERIFVFLKHEKVESFQFNDSRGPGITPLRTSAGVEMGELIDRVRAVYGDPEQENGPMSYYFSRGIAFGRGDNHPERVRDPRRVYSILIFSEGAIVMRGRHLGRVVQMTGDVAAVDGGELRLVGRAAWHDLRAAGVKPTA